MLHISVIMASPCAPDDGPPFPSHGWWVVRERVVFHGKRSRTALRRREFHGKLSDPRMDAAVSHGKRRRRGARFSRRARAAVASRQGIVWRGVGISLFTCSSSGGRALSRPASTSAGAALRATGGPPARVSREASRPTVLSPALLVCACTNEFEPSLSGASYDVANGSEEAGLLPPLLLSRCSIRFRFTGNSPIAPSPRQPAPPSALSDVSGSRGKEGGVERSKSLFPARSDPMPTGQAVHVSRGTCR